MAASSPPSLSHLGAACVVSQSHPSRNCFDFSERDGFRRAGRTAVLIHRAASLCTRLGLLTSPCVCRIKQQLLLTHQRDTFLTVIVVILAPQHLRGSSCTPCSCAVFSSWVLILDQLHWALTYKLLLLNSLAFLVMEAFALVPKAAANVSADCAWFCMLGLLAPMAVSFMLGICQHRWGYPSRSAARMLR